MKKSKVYGTPLTEEEWLGEVSAFVSFLNPFRAIERQIHFAGVESRERNGEHSFQLDMIAWFINDAFSLGLNNELLFKYAKVHDLPEVYAGDTPAFPDFTEDVSKAILTHADKKEREAAAIEQITEKWGKRFPQMVEALHAYERQEDEESRLIYALDKLVAVLNIIQDGGRTWKKWPTPFLKMDAYVRPLVARHSLVKGMYEAVRVFLQNYDEEFFPQK